MENGKIYGSENRRKMYDNLTDDGFDLGSFDDFNRNMDNKDVRRSIYEAAKGAGWNVPEYGQFDRDMTVRRIKIGGEMQEVDHATYDDFLKRHPSGSNVKPKKQQPQSQPKPQQAPAAAYQAPAVEAPEDKAAGTPWGTAGSGTGQSREYKPFAPGQVRTTDQPDGIGYNASFRQDLSVAQHAEIERMNDYTVRQLQNMQREEERRSQPLVDTGSPEANQHVVRTQGQWEDEVQQGVNRITSSVVAPAVDKAIAEFDKKASEVFNEGRENTSAVRSIGQAGGFGILGNVREANEAKDPEKILNYLQQQMEGLYKDSAFAEEVGKEADKMGIDRTEYIENIIKPKIQQDLATRLTDTLVKRELPKSSVEYIMNGLGNSIIGMLYNTITESKGQRQIKNQAEAMTEEGLNPNYNPGTGAKLTQMGVSFAADAPFFGLYGKVSGQVAKKVAERQIQNLMGKGLSETAARSIVGAALENSVGARMKNYLMQHVISSSLTMGGYNATSEAARQMRDSEFDPMRLAGSTAEGLATGAAFGVTGAMSQALSQPLTGISRVGAKAAGFAAEAETMYATEELAKMVQGEEGFTNPFEGSLEAMEKLGVMKASGGHLLTKTLETGADIYKNGVRKAVGKAMSAKPSGMKFTKEEEAYVRDTAEGRSLLETLSSMHPDAAISEVNGKKKLTPEGEQMRRQLADNYNAFMSNPEIPAVVKQKVAGVLGGVYRAGLETGADIVHNADGSVIVKTRDKDGNCVRDLKFDTFSDAEQWREECQSEFSLNDAVNMWNATSKEQHKAIVLEIAETNGISPLDAADMVQKALNPNDTSLDPDQFNNVYGVISRNAFPEDEYNPRRRFEEGKKITPEERHFALVDAQVAEEALAQYGQEFAEEVMAAADYPDEKMAELAMRRDVDGPMLEAAKEYFNAAARMQGMMDQAIKTVDEQVDAANAEIRRNTHPDSGMLITGNSRGRDVYVSAGHFQITPEGKLVSTDGSGAVIVRDANTGEIDVVNPNDVVVTGVTDPRRLIEANDSMDGLRGQLMKVADDSIELAPGTPEVPQEVGETFVGADGKTYMVSTISDENGNMTWAKTEVVPDENGNAAEILGEPQPFDIDEYRKAKSNEIDAANRPEEITPEGSMETPEVPLEAAQEPEGQQEGKGKEIQSGNAAGEVSASAEDDGRLESGSAAPSRIPVDEKGKKVYEKATPEDTLAELTEKYGEEKAGKMIAQIAESAAREYDKLQKTDTSSITDMADLEAHEDKLAEARQKAEYWQDLARRGQEAEAKLAEAFTTHTANIIRAKDLDQLEVAYQEAKAAGVPENALSEVYNAKKSWINLVNPKEIRNFATDPESQAKWVDEHMDEIVDTYIKLHGNLLDPDKLRDALTPIGYNGKNVPDFKAQGKRLTAVIYDKMLKDAVASGKTSITLLTGAGGAGKSTATRNMDFSGRGMVYDSAFNNVKSLDAAIKQAKKAGMTDIQVVAVYNDAYTSFNNTVERGLRTGRFLALEYFVNEAFLENQGKIADLRKLHPDVEIIGFDNSGNKAAERPEGGRVSADEAEKWDYSLDDAKLNELLDIFEYGINEGRFTADQAASLGRGLRDVARQIPDVTPATERRVDELGRRILQQDVRHLRPGVSGEPVHGGGSGMVPPADGEVQGSSEERPAEGVAGASRQTPAAETGADGEVGAAGGQPAAGRAGSGQTLETGEGGTGSADGLPAVDQKTAKKYQKAVQDNVGRTFSFTDSRGIRSDMTIEHISHDGQAVVTRRDYDADGNPIGEARRESYNVIKTGEAIENNVWQKNLTTEEKLLGVFRNKKSADKVVSVLTDEEREKLWNLYESGDRKAFNELYDEYRKDHFEDLISLEQRDRASAAERTIGYGTRKEKVERLRKLYKGNEEAAIALDDESMQPRTVEEYIADALGDVPKPGEGFLAYTSYDQGGNTIVGLKDETGFGSRGFGGDTKGFNPWLAPNGKGKSLKQFAESVHESLPEGMKEQYSDQDLRNIIYNVLTGAEKPTDISNMIIRDRMKTAEEAMRREEQDWIDSGIRYQKMDEAVRKYDERLAKMDEHRVEQGNPAFDSALQKLDERDISIDDPDLLKEYGLKNVTLSRLGDHLTLTHFIVDSQGQGNGTRFMEDLARLADEKGWTLDLTPDTSFGATSIKRLMDFYKRFGFKDNKGRNTDFFTRESMVRRPKDWQPVTPEQQEKALRDAVVDHLRQAGIEVSTDWKEGQRILDDYNSRMAVEDPEAEIKPQKVTDEAELEELNNGKTVKRYRAMQLIDGKLYPPMSAKVDGEMREPTEIGVWEKAEERPDLIKNGKFVLNKGQKGQGNVPAAYNPYFHTSTSGLNDQFTSAYKRPELVVVEVEIPESELTSGYKAEGAKDAVGNVDWHSGVVNGQLPADRQRQVTLSRYSKVNRIVPDSEVADMIAKQLEGTDIEVPYNVVTPAQRAELEKRGVKIGAKPAGSVTEDINGNPIRQQKVDEGSVAQTVDMRPIEERIVKNPNIRESLDIQDKVAKLTPEEVVAAYKRINEQMLDEEGLNVDELEEKIRQEYIAKHGVKGLGQVMADNLNAMSEKYGYGMLSLRWDLLDRIENEGLQDMLDQKEAASMQARVFDMHGRPMLFKTKDGHAYGYTYKGKIYLDPRIAMSETPVHEYGHLWAEMKRQTSPEEWDDIKRVMLTDKLVQPIIDRVKRDYPELSKEGREDDFIEEIITQFSGKRGAERLREIANEVAAENGGVFGKAEAVTAMQRLKNILNRFWEGVAKMMGWKYRNANQIADRILADMLNGVDPRERMRQAASGKLRSQAEIERTLMGVHNLSEDKLRKVLKQGGLANPSLAVVDTNNHMHTDYGDISLIPKSSLIDSRTGNNAGTFTADAWTPTYPQVQKRMSDKGMSKFWKDIRSLNEDAGEVASYMRMAFDTWLDKEAGQERLAYWYMKEKGLNPELVLNENPYGEDVAKRIDELTDKGNLEVRNLPEEQIKEIAEMYRAYKESIGEPVTPAEERIAKLKERIKEDKNTPFTNLQRARLEELEKYGELLHNLNNFEYAVRRSAVSEGKPNVEETISKAAKAVKEQNLQQDFDKWLQDKADSYGVEEWLFNGTDYQGRQKWVRNTLENASKLMKKEGLNGATNWSSIGNWIAKVASKEKTLEGIRKNKANLNTTKEEHEAFHEEWGQKLRAIADKLGNGDWYNGDNILGDALDHYKNISSYLKREYNYDLSAEDRQTIEQFVNAVQKKFPTGYFETKFERPVYLNEFAVAVVPETTSPEIVEALKNSGLDVRTYDNTGTEDQKDANRKQVAMDAVGGRDDIMFQMVGKEGTQAADKAEGGDERSRNLALAEDSEKAGVDPKAIKYATGWERGADGQWRYEIPDADVDIVSKYKQARLEHDQEVSRLGKEEDNLLQKYQSLTNAIPGRIDSRYSEEQKAKYREMRKQKEKIWKQYLEAGNKVKEYDEQGVSMSLGELMGEDKELFKYYPELKDLKVTFTSLQGGTAGSFGEDGIKIGYNELKRFGDNQLNNENVYGTLLHEIQHAIQDIEGFAQGGNLYTSTSETGINAIIAKKEAEKANIKTELDAINKILSSSPEEKKDYADLVGKTVGEYTFYLQNQAVNLAGKYDNINQQIDRLRETKAPAKSDAMDLYHRLAGEVEARNVDKRLNMSEEERRNSLASETEDVPREDQVIIMDDGTSMNIKDIKPVGTGDFGEVYDQFKGKPKEAVDFLVKKKGGDLLGVFHRDEVGDIDLVWGESHNPYRGKGLSHIIRKHIETLHDFKDIDELSAVLDDVVNNGSVGKNGNNIEITKDGYRVVLAQEDNGKKWVLTAFDNSKTKKEKLSSANTAGTPIDTFGSRAVAADDNISFSEGKDTKNIPNDQENKRKSSDEAPKFQRTGSSEPEMTAEERQYWNKWDADMKKWRERNAIGETATGPSEKPRMQQGEAALDYAKRLVQWNREKSLWQTAPKLDDYRQKRDDKDVLEAARENERRYPDSPSAKMRRVAAELQQIRHAMSQQKAYDKATVKAVTDFAQEFMKMGFGDNLRRGEMERMLSAVKNATGAKDIKREIDSIMNILVDNQLRNLDQRVTKLSSVKELSKTAQGVEKQGRLELKGQRMIQAFRQAREGRMDAEKIRERMSEVVEKMARNDEEAPMWEQDYEGLSIALQYQENIEASRDEYADLDRVYKAAVENYKGSGRSYKAQQELLDAIDQAMMENKIERIGLFGDIIGRLEGNIGESMQGAKEFVERDKERVKHIQQIANFDLAGKPADAMREKQKGKPANFFLQPLATFEQMLRQFGGRNAKGEGHLYDYFMRNWIDSVDRSYVNEQKAKEELDAKAREVFGDKVKRWSDLYELERRLPTMEVEVLDGENPKTFTLNQGNLLYIYMADKMADGRMKLRNMGIDEENVEAIKDFLDPRLKELGDWLQDEYLPSKRTAYNKVHERMFGAPMAAIDNYFPIRIINDARYQEEDVNVPDRESKPSTITGNIIKRTKNALPLDILHTDALSLIIEHVEDMERWAATAEWNRDIGTLLSYTTFRNKVKNMNTIYGSGDALWEAFKNTASMAAGKYDPKAKPGSVDKAISNIAKGVTAAKINFRVYTAFKQILSAPAFLHDVDLGDFVKNSMNPYGSWKWAMENMPVFKKRWKSRQVGDTRLMDDPTDWKMWKTNVVQMATRLGMSPNALVDGVTCAVGARSIYEARYKKYKDIGASDEVARKRALQDAEIGYNLTQQSSEGAFVSAIQKDRTVAANMLSVFRNSSMAYTRQWVDAARNLSHRAQKGYKEDSINFMTRQLQDQFDLDEAEARKAAEKEYARAARHDVARLLNMMFGVTTAWNIGASLPYLLMGDDDETKKEMLTDAAVRAMIAGPTEGMAAGNLFSEFISRTAASEETRKAIRKEGWGAGIDAALKQGGDYEVNPLPLMADIQGMIKKMGYDKYAAAQDVFNICMQSAVGVNPQTFTDMWNACMDYGNPDWMPFTKDVGNDDLANSKEIALFIMRLMNAPTSSWRNKYIDELGMNVEDAKKLPYEEMARRYANYKHWKDAPVMGWFRGDDKRQEKMDKIQQQFDKAVEQRMERLTDKELMHNLARSESAEEKRKYAKIIAQRMGVAPVADLTAKQDLDKNWYQHMYQERMEYEDIREEEMLDAKLKDYRESDAGDRTKAEVKKRLDWIRNGKYDTPSGRKGNRKKGNEPDLLAPGKRQFSTDGDEKANEAIMKNIRQWRKEALEILMRAESKK